MSDEVRFKINTKPREQYFVPDIALADVENEQIDARNPLDAILKKAVREKMKGEVLDNLTDEQ